MERWGITPRQFNQALKTHHSDDAIYRWLLQRTTSEKIAAANRWLVEEKASNMDRQDAEEGVLAERVGYDLR